MSETIHKRGDFGFEALVESAPDAIVVADSSGRIILVNEQTERMFGYPRDELIGQPVELLVPDGYHRGRAGYPNAYIASTRTRPKGAVLFLTGRKKDGIEFPVEINWSLLKTEAESGALVTGIIRDITEQREGLQRIEASLREKEVLLKEIHHRVKNNLQVTSSLLRLQSGYIQDPASKEMFAASENRIRSMALIHEKLYQSSDLSRIDMSDYLDTLGVLLMRSLVIEPGRIRLEIPRTDVLLSIEAAVPCGLIFNELISNSLKHSFTNNAGGTIRASVERRPGRELALSVADDGKGLPTEIDFERLDSLGLKLVHTLTRQLDGRVELARDHGTQITIVFPEPEKLKT